MSDYDQPAGPPLPPLDSSNPEWRASRLQERMQREAAGFGRHWSDPVRPKVKSSSRGLRRFESERAWADVLCGQSVVARLLATDTPGRYELAFEAVQVSPKGGWGVTSVALDLISEPIPMACRCSVRMHHLDPAKLTVEGEQGPPKRGRPRRVPVSRMQRDTP